MGLATRVIEIRDVLTDAEAGEVCGILRGGGVAVFPTDTVYGIGCARGNDAGIARIFELKGRADGKPLPLLVADRAAAEAVAGPFTAHERRLADAFWPGALTLVVVRGAESLGLRVPRASAAAQILERSGPLWVTSANASGQPEIVRAAEARAQWDGRVDALVLAQADGHPTPSTVVRVDAGEVSILRAGAIGVSEIHGALRPSGKD